MYYVHVYVYVYVYVARNERNARNETWLVTFDKYCMYMYMEVLCSEIV